MATVRIRHSPERSPSGPVRRVIAAIATALLVTGLGVQPAAATTTPALPTSMAAVGDSITRAFNVGSGCSGDRCSQYSWATGSITAIASQRQRIAAAAGTAPTFRNDSVTGAKMAGLASQLASADDSQPEYTTILIGANDACTPSIATMTPTADFTAQFRAALAAYTVANPTGHIAVSSIPNIYNLWKVLSKNSTAKTVWSLAKVCQSMLNSRNTETQRQTVLQRVKDYNVALATVCAEFTNCRYDNGAVFSVAFTARDVSTLDYFHPSASGQTKLADASWKASYWPTP
jgi:lysophospholipase L1-like esterase